MNALKQILNRQRSWASSRGIDLDPPDYTARLEDNLFSKLSPRTLEEYGGAAGQELVDGPSGKPAKMRALESSSALVLNVFEHLRQSHLIVASWCGSPLRPTICRQLPPLSQYPQE